MMLRAFLLAIVIVLVIDDVVGGVLRDRKLKETTKGSKSMKSDAPSNSPSASATETPLSLTVNYRAVQSLASEPPLLINALTIGPGYDEPMPSLVGSKLIFSSPLFCAVCTPVNEEGEVTGYSETTGGEVVDGVIVPITTTIISDELPPVSQAKFNVTVSCEVTDSTTFTDSDEGLPTFDVTQVQCDISLCHAGSGCGFYRSVGSVRINKTGFVRQLSPFTASQTSGTGPFLFGSESFFTLTQIGGDLLEGTAVLDLDWTYLFNLDVLERNYELARIVPGFIPEGGSGPCVGSDEGRRLTDMMEAVTTTVGC